MADAKAKTGAAQLLAFSQAAEGTKLSARQFAKWDEVTARGNAAHEGGRVCSELSDLERYKPYLNGAITIQQANGPHPNKFHLFNRMIEGYLSGGEKKYPEEVIALVGLLQSDAGWLPEAEKALIIAAVGALRTPHDVVNFAYALKTDHGRTVYRVALDAVRAFGAEH